MSTIDVPADGVRVDAPANPLLRLNPITVEVLSRPVDE